MTQVRIVLADDHPVVLAGVRLVIETASDLAVVGEATSGPQALDMVRATKPDIAIVDISLPEMNGIVLTRQLVEENPSMGVIVLTLHDDRNLVDQSLEAGARGYVLKRSTAECLIHAIRGVRVGGLYIDPSIAGRMFDAPAKARRSPGAPALTEREADVLKRVAHGLTNREIAEQLGLSPKSVETYKARAAAKASLKTRRDIVRYASAQGWLSNV